MIKALNVAKYLLSLVNQDNGDTISNLKLQKLLYYVQGYYLAYFNRPLFNEKIEGWTLGPVVPVVYNEYKQYGRDCLPLNDFDFDISNLNKEELNVIQNVFKVYNDYSASTLVSMTHKELPWLNSLENGLAVSNKISIDDMKKYFKTQIEND